MINSYYQNIISETIAALVACEPRNKERAQVNGWKTGLGISSVKTSRGSSGCSCSSDRTPATNTSIDYWRTDLSRKYYSMWFIFSFTIPRTASRLLCCVMLCDRHQEDRGLRCKAYIYKHAHNNRNTRVRTKQHTLHVNT